MDVKQLTMAPLDEIVLGKHSKSILLANHFGSRGAFGSNILHKPLPYILIVDEDLYIIPITKEIDHNRT